MPGTAYQHFVDDIGRAKALLAHAGTLPAQTKEQVTMQEDILRSSWMFAVGAVDAYFCDVYTDLIASCLIAKSRQPNIVFPTFFDSIALPISAVLETYGQRQNWQWRMAAREMMANENVLSTDKVQTLFNKFCRDGHKMFGDTTNKWIGAKNSSPRVFRISQKNYGQLTGGDKQRELKKARKTFEERYKDLFQRRHDCIHNCDRPKVSPQRIYKGAVKNVIRDVTFLVDNFDEHIKGEFRNFLGTIGCSNATVNSIWYK